MQNFFSFFAFFSTFKRDSKLLPQKQYRYSDLGFIMLTRMMERLGATTLGYLPAKRFQQTRIVSTAKDTIFRNQWLQGYVHDEVEGKNL